LAVTAPRFLRRARPALGTLVEVGLRLPESVTDEEAPRWSREVLESAFQAIAGVEGALSAFDDHSDVGRFNRAPKGASLPVGPEAARVLRAARRLARESGGLFDVSVGTGPRAWSLAIERGQARLLKHEAGVRLDLGGIAKGHAVDRAFEAMARRLARDPQAGWWVNAGGDLRVQGVRVPVHLRDEEAGGARPWLVLEAGALATSAFGGGARARLSGADPDRPSYVSVASPRCLWSDAFTKVVALSGLADHPGLACYGARAWIHPVAGAS
jgi:FAD:protein FMN transferase